MRAQVISFHCVMKNRLGQVLSSTYNQDVINQRDEGNDRLPGLVEGLQSVKAGEKRRIAVDAVSAYGAYDPRLILELRRSELKSSVRLRVGSQIARRVANSNETRLFRVIRLDSEMVTLDGNHPLAGHDLVFEVEIISAREVEEADLADQMTSVPIVSGHLVH